MENLIKSVKESKLDSHKKSLGNLSANFFEYNIDFVHDNLFNIKLKFQALNEPSFNILLSDRDCLNLSREEEISIPLISYNSVLPVRNIFSVYLNNETKFYYRQFLLNYTYSNDLFYEYEAELKSTYFNTDKEGAFNYFLNFIRDKFMKVSPIIASKVSKSINNVIFDNQVVLENYGLLDNSFILESDTFTKKVKVLEERYEFDYYDKLIEMTKLVLNPKVDSRALDKCVEDIQKGNFTLIRSTQRLTNEFSVRNILNLEENISKIEVAYTCVNAFLGFCRYVFDCCLTYKIIYYRYIDETYIKNLATSFESYFELVYKREGVTIKSSKDITLGLTVAERKAAVAAGQIYVPSKSASIRGFSKIVSAIVSGCGLRVQLNGLSATNTWKTNIPTLLCGIMLCSLFPNLMSQDVCDDIMTILRNIIPNINPNRLNFFTVRNVIIYDASEVRTTRGIITSLKRYCSSGLCPNLDLFLADCDYILSHRNTMRQTQLTLSLAGLLEEIKSNGLLNITEICREASQCFGRSPEFVYPFCLSQGDINLGPFENRFRCDLTFDTDEIFSLIFLTRKSKSLLDKEEVNSIIEAKAALASHYSSSYLTSIERSLNMVESAIQYDNISHFSLNLFPLNERSSMLDRFIRDHMIVETWDTPLPFDILLSFEKLGYYGVDNIKLFNSINAMESLSFGSLINVDINAERHYGIDYISNEYIIGYCLQLRLYYINLSDLSHGFILREDLNLFSKLINNCNVIFTFMFEYPDNTTFIEEEDIIDEINGLYVGSLNLDSKILSTHGNFCYINGNYMLNPKISLCKEVKIPKNEFKTYEELNEAGEFGRVHSLMSELNIYLFRIDDLGDPIYLLNNIYANLSRDIIRCPSVFALDSFLSSALDYISIQVDSLEYYFTNYTLRSKCVFDELKVLAQPKSTKNQDPPNNDASSDEKISEEERKLNEREVVKDNNKMLYEGGESL